ncbi:hypothetical protein Tco_1555298 [Tanacetum coccineum]
MIDRGDTSRGARKPEIEGNVDFEIKGQFLRELRDNTFSRNENEDAYEHVGRILEIASLFNIPRVSGDAIILRVFPLTLIGWAKRWLERAPTETINTWDLLKRIFILRFCPPSKTSKQIEEIHNFRQEGRETLYQVWERYKDLLFKCPTHDLNDYQKVNTFYKGLEICTHQMWDSRGSIPELTATRALVTIQEMADHSHKRALYELGDEMHYLSSEEVKFVKAAEYREDSLRVTPSNNSPSRNSSKLEEILEKNLEESCKRQGVFDEWMERFRDNTDKNLRR